MYYFLQMFCFNNLNILEVYEEWYFDVFITCCEVYKTAWQIFRLVALNYIKNQTAPDFEHDLSFNNYVQKKITKCLAKNHLKISTVYYFIDGCASQYKKNSNSLKNLSEHLKDFNMKTGHFFLLLVMENQYVMF